MNDVPTQLAKVDEAAAQAAAHDDTTALVATLEVDLRELVAKIKSAPSESRLGSTAGKAMMAAFEQTANDVKALARDRVVAAANLEQEAISLAETILNAGARFCELIEQEAAKGMHVSNLMQEARKILGREPS